MLLRPHSSSTPRNVPVKCYTLAKLSKHIAEMLTYRLKLALLPLYAEHCTNLDWPSIYAGILNAIIHRFYVF